MKSHGITTTVMTKHIQLQQRGRMLGGFMTCMATSWSGAQIGGTKVTKAVLTPKGLNWAISRWGGVAVGTVLRNAVALRAATLALRPSHSKSSASGSLLSQLLYNQAEDSES